MGGLLCNTESAWVKSEISDWSCSFSWVLNCRTAVSSADCAPQSIPRDPWKCPTGKGVAYWPHNQLRSTVTQSLWARHQPQNDNMQKCPGPARTVRCQRTGSPNVTQTLGYFTQSKEHCTAVPSISKPLPAHKTESSNRFGNKCKRVNRFSPPSGSSLRVDIPSPCNKIALVRVLGKHCNGLIVSWKTQLTFWNVLDQKPPRQVRHLQSKTQTHQNHART